MNRYFLILIIVFCQFNLMAQRNCVDFENFELSQDWIKKLSNLDTESKKDSILNRIKCERFFKKENIDYFELLFVINGYPISIIPEYRDSLLNHIKALNINLLNNSFNGHKHHGYKGHFLGLLVINELDKPIIDNIDALTILKVERKTKYHKRKRTIKESKIIIKFKSDKTQEFMFKIEDFSNIDNYKTERLHIKKGTRTIDFSVDREIKVISIIDSENNSTIIIN